MSTTLDLTFHSSSSSSRKILPSLLKVLPKRLVLLSGLAWFASRIPMTVPALEALAGWTVLSSDGFPSRASSFLPIQKTMLVSHR